LLYAAVALWAGVVLGIMVAFAKDKIDPSLKTVEEADALVLSPALGVLPFERNATQKKGTRLKKTGSYQLAMSLSRHPHSSLSEAFRALGTAVSISPNSMRSLLVTSAQNGEGKTIIAVNLGQVLAQRRGPVLLVDCDLRRNGIAGALGLKNDKGLSTILSGKHTFSESVQTYSYLPNLSVLTSGPVPSNPAELLASEEMEGLLKEMRKQFACVILDSPPMLAVTDATILSTLVAGVLLVAASGSTPRAALLRTRRMLANAGAHVVGIAMNKLDPRLHKYHSYGYPYTIDSNPQDAFAKVG
jgi:capsular exopolysaccharide synthesis family protein